MDKKLYWLVAECEEMPAMSLQGCLAWIESDIEERKDDGDIQGPYTLQPVWMTPDEFENAPEAED